MTADAVECRMEGIEFWSKPGNMIIIVVLLGGGIAVKGREGLWP